MKRVIRIERTETFLMQARLESDSGNAKLVISTRLHQGSRPCIASAAI